MVTLPSSGWSSNPPPTSECTPSNQASVIFGALPGAKIREADPVENRVRDVFIDRLPYTRLISYAHAEDLGPRAGSTGS
jgi:hypothetical protein